MLMKSRDGHVSCLLSNGCSSITVDTVHFSCDENLQPDPIFKLQGTMMIVKNASVSSCASSSDGTFIQSFDKTFVNIESSRFVNLHSSGYGGAIVAFGGSLSVTQSDFINCSSQNGGGAVWASAFQVAYGFPKPYNTTLVIESTTFKFCTTRGAGGAVLASSELLPPNDESLTVSIFSVHFVQCTADTQGGALSLIGSIVYGVLVSTQFASCQSFSEGGGISAHEAKLALLGCTFIGNHAHGLGGGAIHLDQAGFLEYNSSFIGNAALWGGGGVFYWQGYVFPAMHCPEGMTAVEIPCTQSSSDSKCGWRSCLMCPAGTFQYIVGATECWACPLGTYSSMPGSSSCKTCPSGSYSDKSGAIGIQMCKECNPGFSSDIGATECSICTAGTYSETHATTCMSCEAGHFASGVGINNSNACSPCDPGLYSVEGASSCKQCRAGAFSLIAGSSSCTQCPPGQFSTVSMATSSEVCTRCSAGSFSPFMVSSYCILCPAGTYNVADGSTTCDLCPPGKYLPSEGANDSDLCIVCAAGKHPDSSFGASECFECPLGMYSKGLGDSVECEVCPAGKYASIQGAAFCENCTAGFYSEDGAVNCTSCSAGKYSQVVASTSCTPCISGKFSTDDGADSVSWCMLCPSGSYSGSGANECTKCIAGIYKYDPILQDTDDRSCIIRSNSGSLGRNGQDATHGMREKLFWILEPLQEGIIILDFVAFDTNLGTDFVNIYACINHTCSTDTPVLGSFSGGTVPHPIVCPTGMMMIVWTSEGSWDELVPSWSASYTVQPTNLKCFDSIPAASRQRLLDDIREVERDGFAGPPVLVQNVSQNTAGERSFSKEPIREIEINLKRQTAVKSGADGAVSKNEALRIQSMKSLRRPEQRSTDVLTRLAGRTFAGAISLGLLGVECGDRNTALYGRCVASDYKYFRMEEVDTCSPGLPLRVSVIKLDAYNQTVASDSSSFVQLFPLYSYQTKDPEVTITGDSVVQLSAGRADFSIIITPKFSRIDFTNNTASLRSRVYLVARGQDSQSDMTLESEGKAVSFGEGALVCPAGYILAPDKNLVVDSAASCRFCQPGTYSVNPLAPIPGSLPPVPACLNCPTGGRCVMGGADVQFEAGEWTVVNGVFHLLGCPAGYQLVNSTQGTSRGTFAYALQHCKPCLVGQYIINPNMDECQHCPAGVATFRLLVRLCKFFCV
jgi:hypothetical protein